jgi:transcriptional regulator with XRE-family HTH domain
MSAGDWARFDAAAMHAAMEARRRARGVSWHQVAREVGPSSGTIANFARNGVTEADGAFSALEWLGAPAEAFLRREGEPAPGPERFAVDPRPLRQGRSAYLARVNTPALFTALDARREERALEWRNVAAEIGVAKPFWSQLESGGRTEIHVYMLLAQWLGVAASRFVRRRRRKATATCCAAGITRAPTAIPCAKGPLRERRREAAERLLHLGQGCRRAVLVLQEAAVGRKLRQPFVEDRPGCVVVRRY